MVHASPGYDRLCHGTLLATQLGEVRGLGGSVARGLSVRNRFGLLRSIVVASNAIADSVCVGIVGGSSKTEYTVTLVGTVPPPSSPAPLSAPDAEESGPPDEDDDDDDDGVEDDPQAAHAMDNATPMRPIEATIHFRMVCVIG